VAAPKEKNNNCLHFFWDCKCKWHNWHWLPDRGLIINQRDDGHWPVAMEFESEFGIWKVLLKKKTI